MTLTKWTLIFFATYAVLEGVTVGLVGLAFKLSFQSLLLPSAMLLGCGLMFAVLTYWSRQALNRPQICALRFGITAFVGLPIFALVLAFSAVSLGLIPRTLVMSYFIPVVPVGCVIAAASTYVSVRKKAEALLANDRRPTTNDGFYD